MKKTKKCICEGEGDPELSMTRNCRVHCTIDPKLRSFQYKYLMHIVPNSEKPFKYGMIKSSLCDFCSTRPESKIH